MKKLYILVLSFLVFVVSFGQDMVITGAFDGPLTGGVPKVIEVYVINDIADLSTYGVGSANNGGGTDGQELAFTGSATAGDFIYIGYEGTNTGAFATYFGVTADYLNSVANNNGDDALELFSGGVVIDTFGDINTDGTGQPWEYLDGWAYRNDGTGPDGATFTLASWSFSGPNAVDGCTTNGTCSSVYTIGTYSATGSACGVSLGTASYVCSTNTVGDNNDFVEIQIPFTGSDAGITSVTSTDQGATISGDNPATTADGTIVITGQGVQEGYAWDIILNGGDCDGNSTSGTVPADECDPIPNTCFDISGGAELFELVAVATNSDTDVWTESTGTYSMNGYCGGGCTEESDTWLIFGPLDMTSVTDLELIFDATQGFSGTDLNIQYTSAYSGCPDSSTWTSAQTISVAGNYSVDLSAASGTDVFIGVQYLDSDGTFGSWSLSNVELAAHGTCPTLGTRPTSDCAICDLALQTENYVCLTNTAGDNNDGVTVEIPYTGSENTLTSVTTTSGGTVGGDDPITVADGTITITGLSEGNAWDLTLNGGDCDATTVSGTIPASICDPVSCPNAGDLIITEVMQNPSAAGDPAGEYFEVYNNTAGSIDIQGLTIKDDVSATETHVILNSLVIPANGYIVIGNVATTTPVLDYNYGNDISLGNGTDGLILECSTIVIDQVIWDDGATFPDPSGASMELSNTFLARLDNPDNNIGTNWGISISPLGNGDFGTPGAANDFALSNIDFEATKFSVFPNPTNTGYVNITSKNSEAINAKVFDILGKQVLDRTVENNQLEVSNLNAGMYILKLSQNNATVSKKLIIQ